MAIRYYHTEDTIRLVGTFRDWAAEGVTGSLIDPDDIWVSITLDGATILAETAATRTSKGIYYYDWITPTEPNEFIVQFRGIIYSDHATPVPYPALTRLTVITVDVN